MLRLTPQKLALILVCFISSLFGYTNCSVVNSPKAGSFNGSSVLNFTHEGITTNCAVCHDSGKTFGCFPASGHMATDGKDCSQCHTIASWHSGANPHDPNAPVPTTCIACHTKNVPQGFVGQVGMLNNITPTGGLFDHANPAHGGNGDCATCHLAVPDNAGKTFAGAVYSHSPKPTSCLGCHTDVQRPVGQVGTSSFDHKVGGLGDCVGCHASNAANIGRTWATTFSHSPTPAACAVCHSKDTTFTAIQSTIKNQMNHTVTGLPDCATCHQAAAMTSGWKTWLVETIANKTTTPLATLGVFHSKIGTQPATCQTCHANERPTTLVGTRNFDHSTSSTVDCSSCHRAVTANIGKTWAGGQFNHSGVKTCLSCHSKDLPKVTVTNTVRGFTHASKFGTECSTCHTVVPNNIGVTWKQGFFNHAGNSVAGLGNTCSPCHDTRKHRAGSLCTSCHTPGTFVKWPTPSSTGNFGGAWGEP